MTGTRQITMAEVAQHASQESLWVCIEGKVYDVTQFANEHPGGEEVMLEQGGTDASMSFDDVGHSADAKQMLADYLIGELTAGATDGEGRDNATESKKEKDSSLIVDQSILLSPTWTNWLIPTGIAIVVALLYRLVVRSE